MDKNDIVNNLNSIKKLIENKKYTEATDKIEELKILILSEEKDVNDYMDQLVSELK